MPVAGVSAAGMSVTPLILYQIYLDDGQEFNVHAQSSAILAGTVRSRFIGRVCTFIDATIDIEKVAGTRPASSQSTIP